MVSVPGEKLREQSATPPASGVKGKRVIISKLTKVIVFWLFILASPFLYP